MRRNRSTWLPILDTHNTHGWLIAAFLRETSVLEGKAMFECVESCFSFNRCLRQRSVGIPTLVAENGNPEIGQCGRRLDEEKKWHSLGLRERKNTSKMQLCVGRQLLDHVILERQFGTYVTRHY